MRLCTKDDRKKGAAGYRGQGEESGSLNLVDTQSIVMQACTEEAGEEVSVKEREREREGVGELESGSEETLCIGGGLG